MCITYMRACLHVDISIYIYIYIYIVYIYKYNCTTIQKSDRRIDREKKGDIHYKVDQHI